MVMSKRFLSVASFLLMLLLFLMSSSGAYKFNVGGKDGWVLNPSEGFSHWAQRNRFQVNDTLFFKYKRGSNSVLVVTKNDYDTCNTKNPLLSLTEGDSVFKFDRSGPFFFISENSQNCRNGQKLIVVVLAVRRNKPHTTPHSPSPSPTTIVSSPPSTSLAPTPSTSLGQEADSPDDSSSNPPSDLNAPAPAPKKNAGSCNGFFSSSVGLVLVISSTLVLGGSFAGV